MHQMVSDCLDYACGIMESAASERAIYEADEAVSSILARRKQQRQAVSVSCTQAFMVRFVNTCITTPAGIESLQQSKMRGF